ncbi:hypothetical protein Glove_372g34 [Diversispora epigaea]|uniref:Uncharacterized protein n=1 Tax=Diversispora epigaea TaxID=1348612 RepID=A0A397H675_9GLOM|nr:hypothetical protein Glove_372g34 [Diversispora epigaea]
MVNTPKLFGIVLISGTQSLLLIVFDKINHGDRIIDIIGRFGSIAIVSSSHNCLSRIFLCSTINGRHSCRDVFESFHDRLLIIGGIKDYIYSSELIYLDLSKSFNNTNLPWNLIGGLPIYTCSSTAIVSYDNSNIFLIGGYMSYNSTTINNNYDFSYRVYRYKNLTSEWTTPSIKGDSIPIRQQMTGVINLGTIYIFGGVNITNYTTLTKKRYNEMNTLYTYSTTMTWKKLNITNNLPPPSSDYSASILPNGIIIYIGGQEENGTLTKMNNIKLFDTNEHEWSHMNATGDSVDARWLFASVLTSDGNITIFGGCTLNLTSVSTKLAVLNTNKYPYEWSIPSSSKANSSPSLYGHTANLYYKYMIITFGYDIDNAMYNSKIKLFDTNEHEWSHMNATGDSVDARWLFASVLTSDGNITIFGGCTLNLTSVSTKLAVLNTNKYPYEWSIPSSSKANSSPSLYGHTANLYYKYMIITFGYDIDNAMYNSKVYLYCMTNDTWVSHFDPPSASTSTSTSSLSPILSVLIGIVVLIVGCGLLGIARPFQSLHNCFGGS